MLDISDPNFVGTAVAAIIIGIVLLTESIFLLIAITGDRSLYTPVRRLGIHHSAICVLLSAFLLKEGFFHFAFFQDESKCMVSHVFRDFTVTLVNWSMVLIAVYAVTLRGEHSRTFVENQVYQVLLMSAVWIVSALLVIFMYAIYHKPFETSKCKGLSLPTRIMRLASDVLSFLMLTVLVFIAAFKSRRCARLVRNEPPDTVRRSRETATPKLIGSFDLFCRLVVGLTLGSVVFRVYHLVGGHLTRPQDRVLSLVAYTLWYFSQTLLFPMLVVRHPSLRHQLKRAIFHKCLVYHHHVFSHTVNDVYDKAHSCRELMRDPEVRKSVDRQKTSIQEQTFQAIE